jgi:hypothetical protein
VRWSTWIAHSLGLVARRIVTSNSVGRRASLVTVESSLSMTQRYRRSHIPHSTRRRSTSLTPPTRLTH